MFIDEKTGIDDFELCRIFINLLDNATNALTDYTGDKRKIIHIACKETDGYLYIRCQNSYSEKEEAIKSKEKNSGHGYGLQIIEEIANKHGGELVTKAEGGEFSALVTLCAASEKQI